MVRDLLLELLDRGFKFTSPRAVQFQIKLCVAIEENGMIQIASPAAAELRSSLSKADVAELTVNEISNLPAENLVCAVRTAELRFLQGHRPTRLESLDREALERLAYLARRCCRNQGY